MSHHYKETDNNLQNSQTPQFPNIKIQEHLNFQTQILQIIQ